MENTKNHLFDRVAASGKVHFVRKVSLELGRCMGGLEDSQLPPIE